MYATTQNVTFPLLNMHKIKMRRITYLECGEWAAAHALGRVPDAARLVTGLHRGEVAALATADLLPVILNSEVIFGYHS